MLGCVRPKVYTSCMQIFTNSVGKKDGKNGGDDDASKKDDTAAIPEPGNYDLPDDIGEMIGEGSNKGESR